MTRKDVICFTLALVLLFAQAGQAQAHNAPSKCSVTVSRYKKNTVTEVWVGHINDGDALTAYYTDMGKSASKVLAKGTTHIGTNVSGVVVKDEAGKKVC